MSENRIRRKPRKAAAVALSPGDRVLLGARGTLMPRDWYRGEVVWTDGEQLLVRMWGFGGQGSWLDVTTVEHVRAVGDHAFLSDFQDRCRQAVAELQAEVTAAENACEEARKAVWRKLDEIGAAGPSEAPR